MRTVSIKDLGTIDYMECWTLQQKFFERLVAWKTGQGLGNDKTSPDGEDPRQVMLICEHPHVYTLGRSGRENNLLIDPELMQRIGAACHKVDRGGDITYHGPGQLVGYPILDLEELGVGLKDYVHGLEEALVGTVARFGIEAGRSAGATGVWLSDATPPYPHRPMGDSGLRAVSSPGISRDSVPRRGNDRKIAAIGVRSSRFVTMHGFALNVNTALEYFSHINPCGFTDRGVTSMARELGREVEMEDVKKTFIEEFGRVFGTDIR